MLGGWAQYSFQCPRVPEWFSLVIGYSDATVATPNQIARFPHEFLRRKILCHLFEFVIVLAFWVQTSKSLVYELFHPALAAPLRHIRILFRQSGQLCYMPLYRAMFSVLPDHVQNV